jgi:hypothetical protein
LMGHVDDRTRCRIGLVAAWHITLLATIRPLALYAPYSEVTTACSATRVGLVEHVALAVKYRVVDRLTVDGMYRDSAQVLILKGSAANTHVGLHALTPSFPERGKQYHRHGRAVYGCEQRRNVDA